jgi:hypothetical protein
MLSIGALEPEGNGVINEHRYGEEAELAHGRGQSATVILNVGGRRAAYASGSERCSFWGDGTRARLAAPRRPRDLRVDRHWALRVIPRTSVAASALACSIWRPAVSSGGPRGHAAFRSLVSLFLAFTKAAWSMTV